VRGARHVPARPQQAGEANRPRQRAPPAFPLQRLQPEHPGDFPQPLMDCSIRVLYTRTWCCGGLCSCTLHAKGELGWRSAPHSRSKFEVVGGGQRARVVFFCPGLWIKGD
jgi:hypothetical protein